MALGIAFTYYEIGFHRVEKNLKPSEALHSNRAAIRRVVESHRARNAGVFGSVSHGRDTDTSDLDILIDPTPGTMLFDIGAIRHKLGKLLGVQVDVLPPNAWSDKFCALVIAEARPARAETSGLPTNWSTSSKPSSASIAIREHG